MRECARPRKLYLPAGYSSMFAYSVHERHMSEDEAFLRIGAARAARAFPAIFDAIAEGRLHLTAVVLLRPHLTPANAAELLAAAEHQSKAEIQLQIARRFPRPDVPTRLEPVSGPSVSSCQTLLVPERVEPSRNGRGSEGAAPQPAPGPVAAPAPHAKVTPLSPGRFALEGTMPQSMHDKLQYARALLGHQVPSGEIMEVLERALDLALAELEKQKFAKTTRPGAQRSSADPRHIPAAVKRAVLERDGGQCTYVSESGQRCTARAKLEFDHIDPVAVGGEATVDNIRLRCSGHNLYAAEIAFGAGFMASKREETRQEREAAKARAAIENDPDRSVIPWLRRLGYRLQEAREAALYCERMTEAPMAERIKTALRYLPLKTVSAGRDG